MRPPRWSSARVALRQGPRSQGAGLVVFARPLRALPSSMRSWKSKAASSRRWVKVWRWVRGKWLVAGSSQVRKSKVRVKIFICSDAMELPPADFVATALPGGFGQVSAGCNLG